MRYQILECQKCGKRYQYREMEQPPSPLFRDPGLLYCRDCLGAMEAEENARSARSGGSSRGTEAI